MRAVPRTVRIGWLGVAVAVSASRLATAQGNPPPAPPADLEARAESAFAAGDTVHCRRAADLWHSAGEGYAALGKVEAGAAAFRNAGRASSCAGDGPAALGYYGRAAEFDNAAASRQLLRLLNDSPLYDPATRGVAADARFVGAVNQLLRSVKPGETTAVTSVEEAQKVLEDLAALRLAPITVKADSGRVDVELRRWVYSLTQPNAPWERVTTDATLRRAPAAYQFRYRDPKTGKETTVMTRCADGCALVIH